jgi:hypothetical protein
MLVSSIGSQCGIERESRAALKNHRTRCKTSDTDFRALQIGKHGDRAAYRCGQFTHFDCAAPMVIGMAM